MSVPAISVQASVTLVDWVARARLIQPILTAAGPHGDAENELSAEVVEALHESDLFRLLIPRELGGAQVDLATFSAVIEAIAEGDGSTG